MKVDTFFYLFRTETIEQRAEMQQRINSLTNNMEVAVKFYNYDNITGFSIMGVNLDANPVIPLLGAFMRVPVGSDLWKYYFHTGEVQIEVHPLDADAFSILLRVLHFAIVGYSRTLNTFEFISTQPLASIKNELTMELKIKDDTFFHNGKPYKITFPQLIGIELP